MDREDIVAQLTAELQSLKIQVAQLEAAAARSEGSKSSASVATATIPNFFQRGDRVRIKKQATQTSNVVR